MFVHLHRHSEWSLGDGTGSAEQYAERAAALGQPSLAITDHGSLAGTLYHMQACEKVGIKPILGMEAYFRQDVTADRERKDQYGYFHLVLLAQNSEGWKNLTRISSQSHDEEHFYQKPSVDWRLLKDNSAGLIATSSCLRGIIPQCIVNDQEDVLIEHLNNMQSLFGDRFYFEIQPHDIPEQAAVNSYIVPLAKSWGIPFVATSDVHSPYADWADTQNIRVMIQNNKTIKQSEKDQDEEYGGLTTTYLMSADELRESFYQHHSALSASEVDEAIKCSLQIAERCEAITVDRSPKVPKATNSLAEGEAVLRGWCNEGMERIGKQDDQVYLDRLEEEFDVMRKLEVFDYFIIVGDMIRWAKSTEPLPSVKAEYPTATKDPIRIGPGRGSAAGSLIVYLSKITAIDPIGYDLLFERFLNEYRTEIPDIDFDIDPTRRQELKTYLTEKWGSEYVVDVAAFQSFGLKAAIQDVARVLGASYPETKKATDEIPKLAFGETLETLEEQYPVLQDYFKKYPDVARHAKRLQGQIKGSSKHPAAVIVTNVVADEVIPLMRAKDGSLVTQWTERANANLLSPYGFLKIDMLVTDALTAQAKAIKLIEERHGVKIDFENPKTFPAMESPRNSEESVVEAFGYGRNLGVFQFASKGISGLLKQIRPTNLEHIIAANALYRPGTLSNGMAYEYAKRKNGNDYDDPPQAAIAYLSKTYGIIVFQEQVMQMYKALAKDVKSAESGVFLKVVAKGIARDVKGKERLQVYYDKFAAGCEEKRVPKKEYKELWDNILAMTTYSFNRSHSSGYALQGYQDQWLKTHYPLEFYAPLLSTEVDKIPQIIRESKQFGLTILPPDINESGADFTPSGNSIRFGLTAVKGIGWAGLQEIISKRRFESWDDFVKRVAGRKCNSAARRALHNCGSFDSLGERADWPLPVKQEQEKNILGVQLSGDSDIVRYQELLKEFVTPVMEYDKYAELDEMVQVGGEIIKVSDHKTKKGDDYARVDVEWEGDEISVNFWKDTYSKYRHMLADGAAILIAGYYDPAWENVSARYCVTAEQLAIEEKKKEK